MITVLAWTLLVFSATKTIVNLAGLFVKDNFGQPGTDTLVDAVRGAGGRFWLVVAAVVHSAFLVLAVLVLLGGGR